MIVSFYFPIPIGNWEGDVIVTIKGKCLSSSSSNPIAGANITVYNKNSAFEDRKYWYYHAKSDERGHYLIFLKSKQLRVKDYLVGLKRNRMLGSSSDKLVFIVSEEGFKPETLNVPMSNFSTEEQNFFDIIIR